MNTDVSYSTDGTLEVLTLVQAKKQLRIEADFTDEDDLIQSYIDAAVEVSEKFIGGHILPKIMTIKADSFTNPLVFEAFPLKEVTSVKYFPADGSAEATMDPGEYALTKDSEKVFRLRFKNTLPETAVQYDAVTYSIKVGMTVIPKPIIQAIKLQLADMYERREDRAEIMTTAADRLLRPYKKYY
jgi:uncharacterized phiE125 gp8 family phage protein